jgi:hypothetical protein
VDRIAVEEQSELAPPFQVKPMGEMIKRLGILKI